MNIDVFVSYHTRSSAHITLALVNALESRGVRCWYAPRDVFGDYATAICSAIDAASVFLLIATSEAAQSEDVLNEINLAVERVRKREPLAIVPFKIENAEFNESMRYYLGRQHWIDAIDPPTQEQIDRVVHQVMVHLGREEHMPQMQPVRTKLIENMPAPRKKLEGRDAVVGEIHQRLQAGEKLFVCGMGGIGKSQAVKKYAQDYKDDYDVRIFANFAGTLRETIISDSEIAIQGMERGSADADVYFARKLKAMRQLVTPRTLLVIDNFDVTGDPQLDEILKLPCHVLFTTRTDFSMEGLDVLYLDAIDDAALYQVFLNNYTRPLAPGDEEHIAQLISMLNRHTMAVEIIAKQMLASRKRPAEMIALLKEKGIHAMNLRERVRYDEKKSAETTYNIFRTLFSLEHLTEAERSILRDLALVPNSGIDARIFYEWSELDTYEDIDSLIQRNWILRTDDDEISLHPLVAEVVVGEMLQEFPQNSIFVDQVICKSNTRESWCTPYDIMTQKFSIISRILELFPEVTAENEDRVFLATIAYSRKSDVHTQCMKLRKNVLRQRKMKYEEGHYRLTEIKYHLIFDRTLSHSERVDYYAEMDQEISRLENEKCYLLAMQYCIALQYMCWRYEMKDKHYEYVKKALQLFEQADDDACPYMHEIRDLYGYDKRYLEGCLKANLCGSFVHMGDLETAYRYAKEAQEILSDVNMYRLWSDDSIQDIMAMNMQSLYSTFSYIMAAMGKVDEAIDMLLKKEQMLVKYRTRTHLDFMSVYQMLIKFYSSTNRHAKADEYKKKLSATVEANYSSNSETYINLVREFSLNEYLPSTANPAHHA